MSRRTKLERDLARRWRNAQENVARCAQGIVESVGARRHWKAARAFERAHDEWRKAVGWEPFRRKVEFRVEHGAAAGDPRAEVEVNTT